MTVAAVIPHWNRRDLLETLLTSLRAQTHAFDEIIVADNGSTDDSAEFAERAGARVLRLGRNSGFAAAVNRGVESTAAQWVAILNNDVTLDPDWLGTLLTAAEREHAAFAAGKLLRTDDTATIDGTFDEISRGACAYRCGSGKPDGGIWNHPRRIRFAPMTAALFRRELFDQIGPLDETFGSYLEDIDFGIRCAMSDRDGLYVPDARAHHRGSSTLGAWNSDTVRLIARNQVLLAVKHFQGQPRWPILAGQLLWGLLAVRHRRGVSYLRGKISGLNTARTISNEHVRRTTRERASASEQKFRAIVDASENEIFAVQEKTGFDAYWRAYFWLQRR
jgi:GT2 family glycosyltransferase